MKTPKKITRVNMTKRWALEMRLVSYRQVICALIFIYIIQV